MQALAPLKYLPFPFKGTRMWSVRVYLKCQVVQSREEACKHTPTGGRSSPERVRVHSSRGQGEHLPEYPFGGTWLCSLDHAAPLVHIRWMIRVHAARQARDSVKCSCVPFPGEKWNSASVEGSRGMLAEGWYPYAWQEFSFVWSGVTLALPSCLVSGFVIYWIDK